MENKIKHSGEVVKYSRSLSEISEEEVNAMFLDSNILEKIKLDVTEKCPEETLLKFSWLSF